VAAEDRVKVVIIGGGCAGITAAFELTRPEHHGKYDVTIYQQGFRLGGKGASGRGPGDRIEEHGLHLWMGFYENAFRLMRECYEELARDPQACRIADWRDAFAPDNFCGAMDQASDGRWSPWLVHFPSMPGLPGDGDSPQALSVLDYLGRAVTLVVTLLQAIRSKVEPQTSTAPNTPSAAAPTEVMQLMSRWMRYGELASLAGLLQAVDLLNRIAANLPQYPRDFILSFHDQIAAAARAQLQSRADADDETRRLWEIIDLTLAVIRGIIRFDLVTAPRGFEAIDQYDCKEWLKLNGASERSVNSAFVRALYDLAFAYEEGDVARPRIAAGQALRGAVRAFFTYRGAFFWKMQSGMGDVVFAPFYEVLRRRGVKFEFFHRLRNVGLGKSERASSEDDYVDSLEFDVQAELVHAGEYEPLVDVRGLPCWPAQPDWSQLRDAERLQSERRDFESHWDERRVATRVLQSGEDFDFVVLAVGLGAIPFVCRELIERSARWQQLVERCKTAATQAFQVWMNVDMAELGWRDEQVNISGYVEPFDTWADMRQLIKEESFQSPVRAIAYFCSVLADPPPGSSIASADYPAQRREETRKSAITFLNRDVARLWPRAQRGPGEFRWEVLSEPLANVSPENADEQRFSSQFWTANVNPSDRYSLSLPGTLKYRISPLDDTFDNLTVAGDWTDSGFNEGCVEAAVMSGRLAAHALSKLPRLEDIAGYDHP
jgi:uncharacterized protein with NAD-binding domain and iron-sulfur cluster